MAKLNLNSSAKNLYKVSKKQQKEISKLYSDLAKEVAQKAKQFEGKDNVSSVIRAKYLKDLEEELNYKSKTIGMSVEEIIKDSMTNVSEGMVKDNEKFLNQVGLEVKGAFSNVPNDIIDRVTSGKVYDGDWSLSKAIWNATNKTQGDINRIIAEGIAQNKGSFDIAKDLEKYVDPKARKDWNWGKVYPGTAKRVDYNAQRLARTMVSHAYQQSLVRSVKDNPFVTGIEWMSALSHGRTCEICAERDGTIYPKDKLPLDHPNGLCTYGVEVGDLGEIGKRLKGWKDGNVDKELDKFTKSLGLSK